ncbi:pyridoxamine 5'-phosphate oxidase-domain-containing protein [Paraphysoderma sedebokerense]|nr:pyridoxamine 5'-phosphate oxidase-domain-containing protein [Paraphysoderma sedebokerense]
MSIPPWKTILQRSFSENIARERSSSYVQLSTIDPATFSPRNRTIVFRGFSKLQSSSGSDQAENLNQANSTNVVETELLQFITDTRSSKIEEIIGWSSIAKIKQQLGIKQLPRADGAAQGEICWYFPVTREQFRLSGSIYLLLPPSFSHSRLASLPIPPYYDTPSLRELERLRLWQSISPYARANFAWPSPGQEKETDESKWVNRIDLKNTDTITNMQTESCVELVGELGQALPNFVVLLFKVHKVDHLKLTGFPQSRDIYESSETGKWEIRSVNP